MHSDNGFNNPDTTGNSDHEDHDLALIKARKLRELKEKAAFAERIKKQTHIQESSDDKNVVLKFLYDRGDEVLSLAESQYPFQTKIVVKRIAEMIKEGELQSKISGGDLLAVFRSAGLNIRINTTINIEDHGKRISLSDRLKQKEIQENEDT